MDAVSDLKVGFEMIKEPAIYAFHLHIFRLPTRDSEVNRELREKRIPPMQRVIIKIYIITVWKRKDSSARIIRVKVRELKMLSTVWVISLHIRDTVSLRRSTFVIWKHERVHVQFMSVRTYVHWFVKVFETIWHKKFYRYTMCVVRNFLKFHYVYC